MSARECRCVHCRPKESGEIMGPWRAEDNCYSCDGTGKVWPSVEGEIVVEKFARKSPDSDYYHVDQVGLMAGPILVSSPGRYRVLVQKIGEEKP